MALKRALLPLSETNLLDHDDVDKLRRRSITTVEEVVGAIDADAGAMAHFLHRSVADVQQLRCEAIELVPPQNRVRLERPVQHFKLGAFPPQDAKRGSHTA